MNVARLSRKVITRCLFSLALGVLLAGCHSRADEAPTDDGAIANYAPPTADATPPPVRVVDGSVLRDLAAGKTEGVYLFDLRRAPSAVRALALAERAEALACRKSGAPDAELACARRERLAGELKAHGLCWGPDAEPESDKRWMHLGAGCRGQADSRPGS